MWKTRLLTGALLAASIGFVPAIASAEVGIFLDVEPPAARYANATAITGTSRAGKSATGVGCSTAGAGSAASAWPRNVARSVARNVGSATSTVAERIKAA